MPSVHPNGHIWQAAWDCPMTAPNNRKTPSKKTDLWGGFSVVEPSWITLLTVRMAGGAIWDCSQPWKRAGSRLIKGCSTFTRPIAPFGIGGFLAAAGSVQQRLSDCGYTVYSFVWYHLSWCTSPWAKSIALSKSELTCGSWPEKYPAILPCGLFVWGLCHETAYQWFLFSLWMQIWTVIHSRF